jgi:hypothetical protein
MFIAMAAQILPTPVDRLLARPPWYQETVAHVETR